MRLPKAIKIFKLLNNNELIRFKAYLERNKKKRLLVLTGWLSTHVKRLEAYDFQAELFQFLFEKPYDTQMSYLLRNEFRLLSAQLELFLARLQIEKETLEKEHVFKYYLLSALQERNAHELIKSEYKTSFEESLKRADYFLSFNLNTLHINQYRQFVVGDKDVLSMGEEINLLRLERLSTFFITEYRKFLFNQTFLHHLEFPFSIYHFRPEEHDWTQLAPEADATAYLIFKAGSYLLPPAQRVLNLERCLAFASEKDREADAFYQDEVKYCLMELTAYYHLAEDFSSADRYYRRFLQLRIPPDDIYRLSKLLDYAAFLLKNGKAEDAIRLLNGNEEAFKDYGKNLMRLRCLKTAAIAMTGNAEELFSYLPMNFSDYEKEEKLFFRLYFSICAWISGMPDQAIREIDNLLNSLQKGAQPDFDVRPTARLLRRYYRWASPPVTNYLVSLYTDVKKFEKKSAPEYSCYLPFLWLKWQLESFFHTRNPNSPGSEDCQPAL